MVGDDAAWHLIVRDAAPTTAVLSASRSSRGTRICAPSTRPTHAIARLRSADRGDAPQCREPDLRKFRSLGYMH
jgi:hypothetical protein